MAAPHIRVAVQSPRRLLRDSLAGCLSAWPDVIVVGQVAEPDALPGLCELARPDVVILDAESQLGELAMRAGDLLRRFSGLNVIMTYREASERDLAVACRAGVTSLVPESHGLAAVLALLRRRPAQRAEAGQGSLTDRELELMMLTGSGHSVAEMAELLRVSPPAVENLKRRLYAKLGVHSSVQAASRGASLGLLDRHLVDHQVLGSRGLPELTTREEDILASIAGGYSIRQTARTLGIAPKTVENIQTRLFRKLGVSNRAGALAVADAFGLLPEPSRFRPDPLRGSLAPGPIGGPRAGRSAQPA